MPLPRVYDGIERKWLHAVEHFKELRAVSDEWQPKAYRISQQLHPDGPYKVFRGWVVEPIPPKVTMLLGDIVQDLRAALDHLAWALSYPTTVPKREAQALYFPICRTPEAWSDWGSERVRFMRDKPKEIIESFQPYHRTNNPRIDPLYVLHRLAIIDRHQTLPIFGAFNSEVRVWEGLRGAHEDFYLPIEKAPYNPRDKFFPPRFENGTVLGVLRVPDDPEMDVYLAASFSIVFTDGDPGWGAPLRLFLIACIALVAQIIEALDVPFVHDIGRVGIFYGPLGAEDLIPPWPPLPEPPPAAAHDAP